MPAPANLNYQINQILLTPKTGVAVDLRFIMLEVNIYEDIFSDTMSGNVVIHDTQNWIKKFPLYGFETITIDFETLTPNKAKLKKTFNVYSITSRTLRKEREQIYQIHFVSTEAFTNANTKVSKSYKGKLISDIADDIMTSYLKSSFKSQLETTKFLHQIIIPRWEPFRALNWLATRANSAAYEGSNYLFFENYDGFNFVSLEFLVDPENPVADTYKYFPVIVREPNDPHKLDTDLDFKTIISYSYDKWIDSLANSREGLYGNRLITHNLIRKIYSETDWDYIKTYPKYKHLEVNTAKNVTTRTSGLTVLSDQSGSQDSPESNLRLYPSGQKAEDYPNQVENWLPERIARLQSLHNQQVTIRISGDSTRRVGDVIQLNLPSPEPPLQDQIVDEIYISGRYLIKRLRHKIDMQTYETVLECVKDSVANPFPG